MTKSNQNRPFPGEKTANRFVIGSIGWTGELRHRLSTTGVLFRCGWDALAKHSLDGAYDGNVFKANFTELRKCYIEQFCGAGQAARVPNTEREFFKFVAIECLQLDQLPRDALLGLFETAVGDLGTIEDNLAKCARSIDETLGKACGGPEKRDQTYDRLYFEYVRDINEKAKQEIVQFLVNGINQASLQKASRHIGHHAILLPHPYAFASGKEQFRPDPPSEIRHKLREVPLEGIDEWESIYKYDKEAFRERVQAYINDGDRMGRVRSLIASNHRLHKRNTVLSEAIAAYGESRWATFCTIVALQIEGIFADYCEELGLSIDGAALVGKLNKINEATSFWAYEYYAFRFPIIRNKIAHGAIIEDDPRPLAEMLLLDLVDVCERIVNDRLPLNEQIESIQQWNPGTSTKKDLLALAFDITTTIPDFYQLANKRAEIVEALEQKEFWQWLKKVINVYSYEHELMRGIKQAAILLKKEKIAASDCSDVLRLMCSSSDLI
jgi:hypothetical protein